jgi:hypothetical protein
MGCALTLPMIEKCLIWLCNPPNLGVSIIFSQLKLFAMKKILFALFMFTAFAVRAADRPLEINQRILKSFSETFTYAEDVVWQENNNQYQANFWQGGINIRARYDEQGNLLETIRYYFEKQLPPTVLSRVKKKYSGKSIFGVTEISSDDAISYFITLQDDRNWYSVRSDAYGNLQETEKFKKSGAE